jgi:AcrR family transcriptional regulator
LFKCLKLSIFDLMSTTTTQEDNIQQQILQAAKHLFQVHGLYKVTMDDVAKAIGKGRSSLYYYYKSKDEIFDAVINVEIKDMMTAVSRAAYSVDTVEQKINAFCTAKLNLLRERRSVYNALEIGMDADAVSQLNKTKVIHHRLIMKLEGDLLNRIFNDAIANGEIQEMDKTKRDALIFVLLSSLHGLKREMRMEDNFDGIETSVSTLTDMVVNVLEK